VGGAAMAIAQFDLLWNDRWPVVVAAIHGIVWPITLAVYAFLGLVDRLRDFMYDNFNIV